MEPSPEDPWHVSWEAMHAQAWWYLNHSGDLCPPVGRAFHGLPRLRLWDDAKGFGCGTEPATLTVYELFADDDQRELVVREAIWQRSPDLSRVHQAVGHSNKPFTVRPTIDVRDAAVQAERFSALLNEAAALRVPVAWLSNKESVTSDVGTCGFEFYSRDQPPAGLKLEWSYDTPPEWQPVIEWCGRMRHFLVACLTRPPQPA